MLGIPGRDQVDVEDAKGHASRGQGGQVSSAIDIPRHGNLQEDDAHDQEVGISQDDPGLAESTNGHKDDVIEVNEAFKNNSHFSVGF